MKQLTYSSMAAARLRANKRQYLSLVLGIFLSIFLVSTLVLAVYGIYLAYLEDRYDKVGFVDMVVLDNDFLDGTDLEELGLFDQIGNVYISGEVTDGNISLGYYDEIAQPMMNLKAIEGRLPEAAGEIALEKTVMDVLDVQWAIGETVELDITPIDGAAETRSFTVVGFLPEQTEHFNILDHSGISQFPAIVTSTQEPGFSVGRLGNHYVMKLKPTVPLNTALGVFWESDNRAIVGSMYGLSTSGEQVQFYNMGSLIEADEEMFMLILTACLLAGALVLSCGVGISGAMEGVLSKRREEIGVLRALGATRKQIRRMFGRENLILALVVSPLSIAVSCLGVWLLSKWIPESFVFGFNLWLLLPIAAFSVVVVLLAGFLPLLRASKLMPMSVIRDTAMLRRSKKVKTKKDFKPTRLIAARQLRFNPTRQIGAALLVGLMLLCSGLFTGMITSYKDRVSIESTAFYIQSWSFGHYDSDEVVIYDPPSMTAQSVAQIQNLEHVKSIDLDRTMYVTAILENVPRYAYSIHSHYDQFGMLSPEQFQEAMALLEENDRNFYEETYDELKQRYQAFVKAQDISGVAYHIPLVTVELDTENLDKLNGFIESGKINVDAINEGREVIVYAPEVWVANFDTGSYAMWNSEERAKADPNGENAFLESWNDAFTAGQSLPIANIYRTEEEGTIHREDANVSIGAVVSDMVGVGTSACILTTEQGLKNMGLHPEGLGHINVYLDRELTLEEEETLERQLNAISRRSGSYRVYNVIEQAREASQSNRQAMLLCFSVSIIFFAVAVGMIVSSVTRQLNSEGRTIGMLRAVGADEKAILGCYSGQVTVSIGCGMALAIGLYAFYFIIYMLNAITQGYFRISEAVLFATMAAVICAMGVACWFACRFFLRFRIREIVNKSIIDNIREL